MSAEDRRSAFISSRSLSTNPSIDIDNPYSVWTCSLTRQERTLGLGVIVRLEWDDKVQSQLPCLHEKLTQQKVDYQPDYALLTCHSNLEVVEDDEHQPKYFDLKGLHACVGRARESVSHKIALEDCVGCAVSCCGPTSMLMLSSSPRLRIPCCPIQPGSARSNTISWSCFSTSGSNPTKPLIRRV